MKVFYGCRLFTGIESSILKGQWEPTGVPTIYKIIEAFDQTAEDFRLVLTCKDNSENTYTSWKETKDIELNIRGLKHPVLVLSGDAGLPKRTKRFNKYLRELRQAWRLYREIRRFKPDLIYFDHSNIWTAGLMARFLKIPVVLRIMGVYPAMFQAIRGKGVVDKLLQWLYRSPFALVICTQDGSNAEQWLKESLNPTVRWEILLNGVSLSQRPKQPDPRLTSLPQGRTIVLFLGKLEHYKGCDYFVDAVLRLYPRLHDQLHALIIGVGNRREPLIEKVNQLDASEMFTFIDRISHEQIVEAHARSDIYVSLNWFGNMSNANLEAMIAGDCMIFPESDPKEGYDLSTDKFISSNLARRVSRDNVVEDVAQAIEYFHQHPEERIRQGNAIAEAASKFIPTWEERINKEMALLRALVNSGGRVNSGERS